jgi:hypothetical protein
MFGSLFSSKNQKLVKKWEKEHEQIVVLAHKVIAAYSKNNHDDAKKELEALNDLAVDHLMDEDIQFYRLLKDQQRLDEKTEELVNEFTKTFKGTKIALMGFLTKYSRPEAILDDEFFTAFNEIVGVLADRIAFEEENLYIKLNSK